jgi:hypothetical protein
LIHGGTNDVAKLKCAARLVSIPPLSCNLPPLTRRIVTVPVRIVGVSRTMFAVQAEFHRPKFAAATDRLILRTEGGQQPDKARSGRHGFFDSRHQLLERERFGEEGKLLARREASVERFLCIS